MVVYQIVCEFCPITLLGNFVLMWLGRGAWNYFILVSKVIKIQGKYNRIYLAKKPAGVLRLPVAVISNPGCLIVLVAKTKSFCRKEWLLLKTSSPAAPTPSSQFSSWNAMQGHGRRNIPSPRSSRYMEREKKVDVFVLVVCIILQRIEMRNASGHHSLKNLQRITKSPAGGSFLLSRRRGKSCPIYRAMAILQSMPHTYTQTTPILPPPIFSPGTQPSKRLRANLYSTRYLYFVRSLCCLQRRQNIFFCLC